MAMMTANGYGVVSADLIGPISRAWTVDLTADLSDASKLTGAVTVDINDGALQYKGTAVAVDVFADTVRARIVAGAAGLSKQATPKFYQSPSIKIILQDLLAAAGETLSSTADSSVLGSRLQTWTVIAMPVADAIGMLMDEVGASWRMLPDGTFWCGSETWSDSGLTYTIEKEDHAHRNLVVTMEAPLLLPGTSLGGRKISYVESHVGSHEVTCTAWLATSGSADRIRDPMVATTKSAVPHLDYLAPFRCRVAAQSSDLTTLDLIPDDARLPAAGFKSIPLRHGLPGCKVQVSAGTYVLLGWMGGDPQKPFCSLWEGGESPQKIQLAGTHPLPMWDTFLTASGALNDILAVIQTALTTNCVNGSPLLAPLSPGLAKLIAFQSAISAGNYNSAIVSNG